MFHKTAKFYDRIYSFKDYRAEAEQVAALLRQELGSGDLRVLDVACGTGAHIEHLKGSFQMEGLDVSEDFLRIARDRHPGILFHRADMGDFRLGRTYHAVICLFSSIGYVKTLGRLESAVHSMAGHLEPGGVLNVEPWFSPAAWKPGSVHALLIDDPDLKIARVSTSLVDGRISYVDFHYLIGTKEGTEHLVERHEMGLFEPEEMMAAFEKAGLSAQHDPQGLDAGVGPRQVTHSTMFNLANRPDFGLRLQYSHEKNGFKIVPPMTQKDTRAAVLSFGRGAQGTAFTLARKSHESWRAREISALATGPSVAKVSARCCAACSRLPLRRAERLILSKHLHRKGASKPGGRILHVTRAMSELERRFPHEKSILSLPSDP